MQPLRKDQALDLVRQRRALFDAAAAVNPYASSAWMLHFIAQVAREDWQFFACEAGNDSLMLLYAETATPNRLQAIGNYYTSLYSPLVSTTVDRAGRTKRLVEQLCGARPRFASINLSPLDAEDGDTRRLEDSFRRLGWYVRRYFCFANWYQPCAGMSFAEYMAQRPSQLTNTWSRKAKKFKGRLEIITTPADVERGMAAYNAVYAKSWKQPEPYPDFVPGWARVCAENGWLRLGIAWLDELPIAAQFWFTMHRRAFIFKLAYDEEYTKLSAGTLLGAELFRHSLEDDKVVEIDYLTGDDGYKRSWMNQRRERIGLIACNTRSAAGLITAAREYGGALRQRWRRGTELPQDATS